MRPDVYQVPAGHEGNDAEMDKLNTHRQCAFKVYSLRGLYGSAKHG